MYFGNEKVISIEDNDGLTNIKFESGEKQISTDLFNELKSEEPLDDHEIRKKKYNYIASVLYTALMKYDVMQIELEPIMGILRENMTTTLYKLIFNQFPEKELNPAITDPKQELTLKEIYDKAYIN